MGERKFTYDIWGDAVNVAALIEQGGEPEKVTISETTFQQVKEAFETEALGEVASGKKGDLSMYTLKRLIPEFSEDTDGLKPNDVFDQKFANLMKVYQT